MREGTEFRELMLQVFRTRMAFRRAMQRTLKRNNAGITFEMLQVLSSLWHEQGITQQVLAERTAKDKACLTNLMNNLEKKGYVRREEDPTDRRSKLVFSDERRRRIPKSNSSHTRPSICKRRTDNRTGRHKSHDVRTQFSIQCTRKYLNSYLSFYYSAAAPAAWLLRQIPCT